MKSLTLLRIENTIDNMSKSVEIFFNLLTKPKEGYRGVISNSPYWLFVFVIMMISVSITVSGNLISPFGSSMGYFGMISGFASIAILLVFKILIITAIYNFAAECFGGSGKVGQAFLGFGFSFIPLIFITPLVILVFNVPQPFKYLLYFLSIITLTIWVIYLQITNIKEIYALSTGKAFAVIIIPSVTFILFVFALIATSIASVITKISGLFQNLPF
jgi:hypothetical protein